MMRALHAPPAARLRRTVKLEATLKVGVALEQLVVYFSG
jgi:hypothetical protein